VVKRVYDGTTGYQSQMGQKQNMSEEELNEKKVAKGLFEQLYFTDADHKLEVKGIEKVNNADAYVLLVTLPGGRTKTQYYDVKTGFMVKTAEATKQNGADISEVAEFSDYKKVGDIYIAHKINRTITTPMGNQELAMTLEVVKLNEGMTAEDFK
jgi:zinc protease